MDVHHHSHTPRKKWTHYFWEFLMLFLAVFCGFLAENQREHYVEHHRSKQYARSLIIDLETDIKSIDNIISGRNERKQGVDLLMNELEKPVPEQNDSLIFHLIVAHVINRIYFTANRGTYEQIKNSGSLRYFKTLVSFGLVRYDASLQVQQRSYDIEDKFMTETLLPLKIALCNPRYIRNMNDKKDFKASASWILGETKLREELYRSLNYVSERNAIYIRHLNSTKTKALSVLDELKKTFTI